MSEKIRIGTRSSDLALWQAETVAKQFKWAGYEVEIVKIDALGDHDQTRPLYRMGITGVFTKNLDAALLNGKIDVAVHSLKDVPTSLPEGIVQAAVLKRGDFNDVLVYKNFYEIFSKSQAVIATGSLRRKAQWLHRYPNHQVVGLRGNVNTRLEKLKKNDWDGAIFAFAGLKRLDLITDDYLKLDWMVPAPAQGAVMVATLEQNTEIIEVCKEHLNHVETEICTNIEREFLRVLEGGCSAPVGALAVLREDTVKFKGVVFSPDGTKTMEYSREEKLPKAKGLGRLAAEYLIERGARKIMRSVPVSEKKINLIATRSLSMRQTEALSSDIAIFMHDFIKIQHARLKPAVVKNSLEHVIFTSQNAVTALLGNFPAGELRFNNIYCVGRKTKRMIKNQLGEVKHMEQSAQQLAHYIVEKGIKKVTYFCGENRLDTLPDILKDHGVDVEEVVCYKTLLTPKKFDTQYDGVLFFSPSAVESFLLENDAADLTAFCLGDTTAKEAWKHFKKVEVAKIPLASSLIDKVNETFSN